VEAGGSHVLPLGGLAASQPGPELVGPVPPPVGRIAARRLELQQRGITNLRRHAQRAAVRFGVLVLADLTSFYVMRALIRSIRDYAVLGQRVAEVAESVMPLGILGGWQFAAALFVSLLVMGCYGQGDRRRDTRRLFMAAALATALPLWMTVWVRGLDLVFAQFSITTVLVWAGLCLERLGVDRVVAVVRPAERHAARTVFLGQDDACRAAMKNRAFNEGSDYHIVGFLDTRTPPAPDALGHISDLTAILDRAQVETLVASGYLSEHRFAEVVDIALASGCQVLTLPRAAGLSGVQPSLVWRRGYPLIELTAPMLKGWQLALKRVIDVVGSVLGLIILSPVMAVVAILVKRDSPGPVFFRQERVGRGGELFRIAKFRTMVVDAEAQREALRERSIYADPRLFKVPEDPRITSLGRWLRRSSVDELPQLFNVLRGEMSLVGPRPPLPSEVAEYEAHHYARFDMKPGITGPWQVGGRNRITDFEQVVKLETEYMREWSIARDIGILLKTVWVVLQMRGAH